MASAAPDAKIDIGRVIGRGVEAISHNLAPFVAVALMLGALPTVALLFVPPDFLGADPSTALATNFALVFLLTILPANFATVMLVRSTILYLDGSAPDPVGSAVTALRLIVSTVILSVLVTLVIAIGLLLLVVPGIIFALALIVTVPVLVAEQPGVIDCMHRSSELTRGSKGQIFLLVLIYIFAWAALSVLLGLTYTGADLAGGRISTAAAIGEGLVSAVSILISSAMTASLYVELRTVKEGASLERLAAIFR